jgi:hypothetical protein
VALPTDGLRESAPCQLFVTALRNRLDQLLGAAHSVLETNLGTIAPYSVGPHPREGESNLVVDYKRDSQAVMVRGGIE